ncbi:G-type lectin S-receptor-like serine/threonine-protein kinase At2g19130 isoform X1 [Papaver somniferum]|uniref:G-type lectin S-receptor-like serine/threonine-protein kinase At2g19130 isoform X1 n=2 Tax=Papaver somniferum TaxID=3469 RepID=UPI000E700123|nr:G-type lectin S-receptor-like serine/threonine-protein kinase At2g19130 isoform X1 [Papaver somniferum]
MLLCTGGLTDEDCKRCADISTRDATQYCPNGKEYIAWYNDCMLRYSNRSIFSVMELEPTIYLPTTSYRVNTGFNELINELTNNLVARASSNGTGASSSIKFAKGDVNYTGLKFQGLVQCTPDLSGSDCNRCLSNALAGRRYPNMFLTLGRGVLKPSCYVRFENSITTDNGINKPVFIVVPIVSLVAVILILVIIIYFCKRKWRIKEKFYAKTVDGTLAAFTYRELQISTNDFSQKLGGGGFGSVFKGVLPDSSDIAVKKLEGVSQGDKQFRSEVITIGIIQHVNLVQLRGFCSEGAEKLLVYDFMPNGSLDSHLFHQKSAEVLDWKTRYQIALGTARGLAYLHEKCRDCIIHCDIKPENILLDADYCPKVADFGLAKLFGRGFSQVLTTMRGTRGYLAPEWISGVAITPKADVYSYGKMLFEMISGKRNTGHISNDDKISYFPAWAATKMNEGDDIIFLVDNRLEGNADTLELTRACRVACWCIQDDETHRPSMGQVVQVLEGILEVNRPPTPKSLHLLVGNQDNMFSFLDSSNDSSEARVYTTSSMSY